MNRIDLAGRIAVVTGGAMGIGRAIAERFVASGAKVELWDLDTAAAGATAREIGAAAKARHVDVTNMEAVAAAAAACEAETGPPDILVTSAGIAGPNAKTWDYPLAEWQKIMRINVDGTMHCCRALLPGMVSRNFGRVVLIASVAGKEGNPNAAAYSTSKAAVIGLTKSLGKETADKDVAVNCITPAAARTRIFDQMAPEHIQFMLSKIPRGRFVEPREIAAMVAWLCSAENSFTTGAVFDISGGRATY
jgi:3-oxoacyl-[acyl-carrier protein] reductase